jgi:hypothetical protein
MLRFAIAAAAMLLLAAVPASAQDSAFTASGPTVSLAVTATTGRVLVQPTTGTTTPHLRLFNSGTAIVFIACGDVTVNATITASMPVAAGTVEIIRCQNANYLAGITSTGTATLYVTPGTGL